ncbi:HAMP domain-containing sensor histidine kinase [uncultured Acetobacteroides sp.]|uniref:HAMP domain-containing sensor histidine kinase n=1 Tax=uncultured Acetobacteroides sp. TaxID=1760811 RepID=UPI0029F59BE2|nr:HAMP domain-containing sensor histidine kinase [uncultured Acetobacteroides sp.]
MNIRSKLAIQFAAIVSAILIVFSATIYISSEQSRRSDFYNRLQDRALIMASIATDVVDTNKELIRRLDTTASILFHEQVMIFDRKGKLVYNDQAEDRDITPALALRIFKVKHLSLQLRNSYEAIGIEYGNRANSYAVFVSAIDKHGKKRLATLRISLIISTLLGILLSFLGGWYFARRALQPMSKVVARVNLITEKNLNQRLNEGNGRDEISELSSTFNRMLERLELAFTLQKSFVSHASHEFRTPLTIMLSEIEMMMMNHPENAELQQMLTSLKEEILNLNNLSTKLLDLAKTNIDSKNLASNRIRMDELVMTSIAEYSRAYPGSKVHLEFANLPGNEDELYVAGEEQLLKTAFFNLMSNACKFSPDNAVAVSLSYKDSKMVCITFRDNGIGIPEEELKNIFQPFHRVPSNLKVDGHGLGLALTSQIIALHQGTITVKSEVNVGSEFTISLPAC